MNEDARIWTVSHLTEAIKEHLESAFAGVWVRGEVSNLRQQSSGHCYFSLKDGEAQISAVLFRGDAERLRLSLRDGMSVLGLGRISVYAQRGNYQVIFQLLVDEGAGRLRQQFEALKAKLEAEGLFARERKRNLPRVPSRIGFVTSPTGAALRDFVSILQRRSWRGELMVLPARVQGSEAATEIAAAIEFASAHRVCEVLVVGRGGGSLEDLWPFNEEVVARSLAACRIPTISAVGHEVDHTLSDLAADVRAETPSAAAEMLSSAFLEFEEAVESAAEDLCMVVRTHLETRTRRIELLQSKLARHEPEMRLANARLRLDDLAGRMERHAANSLAEVRNRFETAARGLRETRPKERLRALRARIETLAATLEGANVTRTLRRGFVILRTPKGRLVRSRAALKPGRHVVAQLHDGTAHLNVFEHGEQTQLPLS